MTAQELIARLEAAEARATAAEDELAVLRGLKNVLVEQREDRIAELEAERDRLRRALREICDHKVEPFDHPAEKWAEHTPETCAECKRWRDMTHPDCNGTGEAPAGAEKETPR